MLEAHVDLGERAAEPTVSNRLATSVPRLEALAKRLPYQRRPLRARQHVFRAGQPRHSVFMVHAGVVKTSVVSEDGREKITGFHLRGDLLGLDALDMELHACDAVSLDVGEVWELSCDALHDNADFQRYVTAALASEIRRDWSWMLATGTLGAEQRVASFLLDLASRMCALGFSERQLTLRMTRAEMGSFLSLQLETVTRALSRLQGRGLIGVDGRQVRIEQPNGLRAILPSGARCH